MKKLLKSRAGVIQVWLVVVVLIIIAPLIVGGWTVFFKIFSFINAPVTGNIPIWVFLLGIIFIVLLFRRRERSMQQNVMR